jgi:hypothetical protein
MKIVRWVKYQFDYTATYEETLCKRLSDGTVWFASSNGFGASMLALFGGGNRYYFRRAHKIGKYWIADMWQTWEFNDSGLFDIVGKTSLLVARKDWNKFLSQF